MRKTSECLPLQGANNVRDLGGYQTIHQKITNTGEFIRADRLYRLPKEDQDYLYNYGIRTVVDLRADDEIAQFPSSMSGYPNIVYHHVPLIDNIHSGPSAESYPLSMHEMYVNLLSGSKDLIGRVFSIFSERNNGGVLFNCTAGKDRTGVVAMLLLKLAEVDEETIVADYSISECNNGDSSHIINDVKKRFGIDLPHYLFESKPEQMLKTLDYFNRKYKSAEDYLTESGLCAEKIDVLRAKLVG